MAWSNLKAPEVPREWVDAIAWVLEGDPVTPELVASAVATLRALPIATEKAGDLPGRLGRIAAQTGNSADLRLAALAALPGGLIDPDRKIFDFLLDQLNHERPVVARTTAADVLAKARLTAEQLTRLAGALRTAGPLEVDRLAGRFRAVFERSSWLDARGNPGRFGGHCQPEG